jgi:pimeloyl-ACP methyl ester carboxylesterase
MIIAESMTADTIFPPAAITALEQSGTRRVTPAGSGDMVWRIWGDGEPLVLLHGGTGSWMHWMRNIEALARDYMLLVPDVPGSGDSASPPMPTNAEAVAGVLLTGIDAILGADRRFALAGFSLGGLIAGYLAKLAGDRVETLVLVGATATTAPRAPLTPLKSWRRLPTVEERVEAHRQNLCILMVRDPDKVDEPAVYMQHHNAERSRVRGKHITLTGDLPTALAEFKGRLAGIWGEHDVTAVPYMEARREKLQQFRPGASFDVVPGAGHWVQYEAADAFNELMRLRLRET